MSDRIKAYPEDKADKFRAMELALEFSRGNNSRAWTVGNLIAAAEAIYAATCTRPKSLETPPAI